MRTEDEARSSSASYPIRFWLPQRRGRLLKTEKVSKGRDPGLLFSLSFSLPLPAARGRPGLPLTDTSLTDSLDVIEARDGRPDLLTEARTTWERVRGHDFEKLSIKVEKKKMKLLSSSSTTSTASRSSVFRGHCNRT